MPTSPCSVIWLTGLSGAGKSTLSDLLKSALSEKGLPVIQLDGDALRAGVSRDLAFAQLDRDENIRRAAEIAKLICQQGFIVICSFITPLNSQRALARQIIGKSFFEVSLECSIAELKRRDPKGLYARAATGEILNFTGISAPYEAPENPEARLRTDELSPNVVLSQLLGFLTDAQIGLNTSSSPR